jgi:hypothetical protein
VTALPSDSMLAYPLRPARLGWLIGLSLAALITQAFSGVIEFHFLPRFSIEGSPASVFSLVLGLILEGVLAMLALRVAVEGFLSASSGRAPDADRHEHVDDGQAFRQLLFWFGVLVLAYFTGLIAGTSTLFVLAFALLLALPAIVSLLVMEDSLRRALNPLNWFEMFQRCGPAYLLMATKLGLLAALAIAASLWLTSTLPRWPAAPLARLPLLYALLAGYYGLGRLLDSQRGEFELAREPELPRPKLGSVEEDALMREVDALAIEEKPAEAAALLARLIRGRGGSPPIHARYRDLLRQAGDREALLQHGHDYVAVLLNLGQERPALALYLASLEVDRDFQMPEPEEVSRLIAIAARGGQAQLAVKLAAEFEARFPRDRDRVSNALTAARLLATRLDRPADARLLLQELIVALPEHSRLAEIETALREIST